MVMGPLPELVMHMFYKDSKTGPYNHPSFETKADLEAAVNKIHTSYVASIKTQAGMLEVGAGAREKMETKKQETMSGIATQGRIKAKEAMAKKKTRRSGAGSVPSASVSTIAASSAIPGAIQAE